MKTPVIAGISAGVIVIVAIGALVGFNANVQDQPEQLNESQTQETIQISPPQETKPEIIQEQTPKTEPEKTITNNCKGTAGCFTEYVTRIVDGDTIHTNDMKIRLSLANAPETYQAGYKEATEFTKMLCPVGSKILIDQDDLQKKDQYGRILAKVFCGEKILNSELLSNGHATILTIYCATSEFAEEPWAKKYGCFSSDLKSTPSKTASCDPSYPDFCIPISSPDLDCSDLPHKNFRVNQPDPHRLDGDKDGIGCES